MAARCVLECLRSVKSDEDCYQVLQLMVRLSDDIGESFVFLLCFKHLWMNWRKWCQDMSSIFDYL
jgi:hypothetical protein